MQQCLWYQCYKLWRSSACDINVTDCDAAVPVIPVLQIVMQQFCENNVTDCDAAVPEIPVLQTVMQQCLWYQCYRLWCSSACDTSVTDCNAAVLWYQCYRLWCSSSVTTMLQIVMQQCLWYQCYRLWCSSAVIPVLQIVVQHPLIIMLSQKLAQYIIPSSYVYWTVNHCDNWRIKDQLDDSIWSFILQLLFHHPTR